VRRYSDLIRERFSNEEYRLLMHCHERMDQRMISETDIRRAGENGQVIEVQSDARGPRVLVMGKNSDGRDFYMVIALTRPNVTVITVCLFWEHVWEEVDALWRRR
jgi:hypothetical protein